MPSIYPFRGVHPSRDYASRVFISHENAANLARSQAESTSNPLSFLHVTHPEYDCSESDKANAPDDTDSCCLSRSRKKFNEFLEKGILERDGDDSLYVYRLTFRGREYTGIVGCVDVADYTNGKIMRHEMTQEAKARAQMRQLRICGINAEPVLLTYKAEGFDFSPACKWAASHESMFRFEDGDTVHEIWQVSDPEWIRQFREGFEKTKSLFICDGHHRIAAAALYAENGGAPESRKLMASIFPPTQMTIFDYNRTVRDFGGMSDAQFIDALKAHSFDVEKLGETPVAPKKYLEFTMVTGGVWYRLTYTGDVPAGNAVDRMNVSILQEKVFKDILGIGDSQCDGRLGFVNGLRGLEDLQKEASTRMRAGFAIPPVTMDEFIAVAEAGLVMPPKSTCFAPKPVSGMIIHDIVK